MTRVHDRLLWPLATTLLIVSAAADADGLNDFAQCQLVPAARFSADQDTAVGLISDTNGAIHWQFYGADAQKLDADRFVVEDSTFYDFIASRDLAPGLIDRQGYLLFCLDDNDDGRIDFDDASELTANAFLTRPAARDVAYIPTLAVFARNLNADDRDGDIDDWGDDPIDRLDAAAGDDQRLFIRYFIDGAAAGDDTAIYIYTSRGTDDGETMTAFGASRSDDVRVPLTRDHHLNVVDAETIAGLGADGLVGSGFLRWTPPDDFRSTFVFSLVDSDAFGATQTVVGSVRDDD